jgi:hypothetical protein
LFEEIIETLLIDAHTIGTFTSLPYLVTHYLNIKKNMEKINYKIDHSTNNLKIYNAKDSLQYTASWFLEFGKTTAEIYNLENEIIYAITKRFKFWQWKMSYNILANNKETLVLNSANTTNSVFKMQLNKDLYEVQIHYFQKKSFFKNGVKIAEINDAFAESFEENTSNILLLKTEDLEVIFLLFTCLKTGVVNQKSVIKSQKELISLEEKWGS